MLNQLPDLEKEDIRYNLHVGAEVPETYNITLIYPVWPKPQDTIPDVPLQSADKVRANLAKLGIAF